MPDWTDNVPKNIFADNDDRLSDDSWRFFMRCAAGIVSGLIAISASLDDLADAVQSIKLEG